MRAIRCSSHALKNLADREIEREEADRTLAAPEFVAPGPPGRKIFMRRYFDTILREEMLLRIVVEEKADEIIVVTIYKTSQIDKYMKGRAP